MLLGRQRLVLLPCVGVFWVEARLVLGLGGDLDLELCFLGRLEIVGEVGGLVQALEGARGVGNLLLLVVEEEQLVLLLLLLLVMARSAVVLLVWVGS